MFMTGGYHHLPFHAVTQTRGEPTYPRSHHPQSELEIFLCNENKMTITSNRDLVATCLRAP